MSMNVFARNRMVAMKTAAKQTGLTYEEVKAAVKANGKEELDDARKKAVNVTYAVLRGYGKAYKAAQAEAPAVETAE